MRAATIGPLTTIRAPFAALVMLFHAMFLFPAAPDALLNVGRTGYAGVSFFFVLSGFILANVYAPLRAREVTAFWWARFARIYPVYLFGLALAAPFVVYNVAAGHVTTAVAAGTGTLQVGLAQAWWPDAALSWNDVGWSLSAEACFYALFPTLVARLRGCSDRCLLGTCALVYAVQLAASGAGAWLAPHTLGAPAIVVPPYDVALVNAFRYNPLLRLPEFVIGMCAGLLYLRHAHALARHAGMLATSGAAVTLATLAYAAPHVPYLLLHNGLLAPAIGMAVVGLAALRGRAASWWSAPWLLRLGAASYALYIVHHPLLSYLVTLDKHTMLYAQRAPELFGIAYMVIAWVLALAVMRLIEEPARAAIRARVRRRSRPMAGAEVSAP